MKAFRERLGKEYRSKRFKIENYFTVKYLGCASGLAKDIKVVEKAVNKIENKALNKDKNKQLSGRKYCLHITENIVSLYPKVKQNHAKGDGVISIPIEKISYGYFPPKKSYQILALNRHVSRSEVESHVICCNSKEKMDAIKYAFYFAFKGRYFSKLQTERRKRKDNMLLNEYSSFEQKDSRQNTENPLKSREAHREPSREEPLMVSNHLTDEYSKEEKQRDFEKKAVVDINYQEQRETRKKSVGTQNNFFKITAC